MLLSHSLSRLWFECRRSLRRLLREEGGATAIMTAVVMSVMLGFTALGVEVGLWYGERRAQQTAADAAALGAAYKIYEEGFEAEGIVEAGKAQSSTNGYTDGVESVTVSVTKSEVGSPAGYKTEAIVTQLQTSLLSALFNDGDVTIKARAVAFVKTGGPFCVLALDPTSASSLRIGGTADLTLENCGIIVDSESPTAMSLVGGAVVGATYADIYGGYTKSNSSTLILEEGDPNTGVDPLPDPFAHLDIPSGSGCDYNNFQTDQNNNAYGGAPEPLSPGRYCGGLRVRNIAHMAAGNYIIVGGDFKVVAGAVLTSDVGVTIFLTGSGTDYAQVDIAGGATVNISAPTTGTYQGLAFFQDRAAPPVTDVSANTFNGGSAMEVKGAIYIPNQAVQFSGGNDAAGGCTRIVAFQVEFTGNSDVDSDCTGFGFDDETRREPELTE